MAKRKGNPLEYKFSFLLAFVMLFAVLGFFVQSYLEIRKVKPVRVVIERITEAAQDRQAEPESASAPAERDE